MQKQLALTIGIARLHRPALALVPSRMAQAAASHTSATRLHPISAADTEKASMQHSTHLQGQQRHRGAPPRLATARAAQQQPWTTAPPAPPPAAQARPDAVSLDLWRVLLLASGNKMAEAVDTATSMARSNAARLQRLVEPPPQGFPPGPAGEQVAALLSGPLEFLERTRAQYGDVVGLLLGGERVVLVANSHVARQVMVEQAGTVFVKQGTAFFPGSSLAGNGLLVSDGEVWTRQRRLSNPSFRRAAVDTYADAMVAATQHMLAAQWQPGQTRDVYVDFNQLTLQVTLEALFGCSLGSSPTPPAPPALTQSAGGNQAALPGPHAHQAPVVAVPWQDGPQLQQQQGLGGWAVPSSDTSPEAERIVTSIAKAFEFFTRRAGAAMLLPEWLPTWDNLEFASAVAQLDKVVYGIISERRHQLAASSSCSASATPDQPSSDSSSSPTLSPLPSSSRAKQDLLQTMLCAVDEEDGSGMTDVALRDELMTLLVAGQETSAILLGWACALLAAHPDVQESAAAEVMRVVGPSRPPGAGDTRALPVVESVVLEALRLYAPAYLVGRCAARDTTLTLGPEPGAPAYHIPAGTTILISPYLMHRDEAVWGADASEFRPQRWQAWQAQAGQAGFMQLLSGLGPNGSYLPFGAGPRNCIGTGFAMMEAILVLAAILQRYELRPATSQADAGFPAPRPQITLRPSAVQLRLLLRP